MGREMKEGFGREGTWVYQWPVLGDVLQKTTKFCKANILQPKNKVANGERGIELLQLEKIHK